MKSAESPQRTDQEGVLPVIQTRQQTRAFYNRLSGFYDVLTERSERAARREALTALAPAPRESLLEVGSGTGHGLQSMARGVGPKGKIYGLDLSEGMLSHSRQLLRREGLLGNVTTLCGDALFLPLRDGSVDGIFTSFTLELFDTPVISEVLSECLRVLRPGGRLVVVGMSKKGRRWPLSSVYEWAHQHFPKLVDCRPIYVERALTTAGFDVDLSRIKYIGLPVEIVRGKKRI